MGGAEVPPSADEGTLVEVLSVAPDAYVPVICAIFQARNIDHAVCQESAGGSCYGDCDSNGVLDIFDFLCFQNSFVNGETYACDCDTSTGPLVCDLFDFLCFQGAFVSGCP